MSDEEKTIPEVPGETGEKNNGDTGEIHANIDETVLTTDTMIEDRNPYETGQFKAMQPQKKPYALYVVIALLVVSMATMAWFLFFKDSQNGKLDTNEQVRQMQQLTQKVQGMETDVKNKEDEIFQLMDDYKEKTGQESVGVNALNLSPEERQVLQKKITNETDVSVKSLLEDILEKNNEIAELKEKIEKIEALLPKPHIVKAGENHYTVAMNFLVNQNNLEKKEAIKLVERTALFETLVPGFKVWNFYTGQDYGTSVTQGDAAVSPNTLIRRAKKVLVDARDEAVSQRDKLANDITALEKKREQIITQLATLTNEKENLISKVTELNQQNQEMQETVNSLFYLMDTRSNLKKRKILKGGFLRSTKLQDVSPEHFTMSVDLRSGTQIPVSAADLGVTKIRSITVYPKFYKRGTDYNISVAPDKQTASITVLDSAKFKNERVVIAIK